jgi:transcriptional regulator with XRE-family HTH domain
VAKGQAIPFAALVGPRFRARRHELGFSQDEVARRAGTLGFAATRAVIDAIERGSRSLDVPEWQSLLFALDTTAEQLLESAGPIARDGGISIEADAALGKRPAWRVTRGADMFTVTSTGAISGGRDTNALRRFVGAYSDAEVKAARALRVTPREVAEVAETLWGRPLHDERDERVRRRSPGEVSRRSLQALRGRVTRDLLDELRAAMA